MRTWSSASLDSPLHGSGDFPLQLWDITTGWDCDTVGSSDKHLICCIKISECDLYATQRQPQRRMLKLSWTFRTRTGNRKRNVDEGSQIFGRSAHILWDMWTKQTLSCMVEISWSSKSFACISCNTFLHFLQSEWILACLMSYFLTNSFLCNTKYTRSSVLSCVLWRSNFTWSPNFAFAHTCQTDVCFEFASRTQISTEWSTTR